jgi:hypothetical protein
MIRKCGLCADNIFTDAELAYQDIQVRATTAYYPGTIEQAMNTDANAYMHDLLDAFAIACEYSGDDGETLQWLVTSYKMASTNPNHSDCMAARAISHIDREWLHQIQSRTDHILPVQPLLPGHINRIGSIAKAALKKLSDHAFPDELKKAHEIQDCHRTRLAFTNQQNSDTGWYHIASVSDDKGDVRDHSTLIAPRLSQYHATRLTKAINRCLGLHPLDASMIIVGAKINRERNAA